MNRVLIIFSISLLCIIMFLKFENNNLKKELTELEVSYRSNLETLDSYVNYKNKTEEILEKNKKDLTYLSNKIYETKEYVNESKDDIITIFNNTIDRLFAKDNSTD